MQENNKKLERALSGGSHRVDTELSSGGKLRSNDVRASTGSMKNSNSYGSLAKMRADKSLESAKKTLYNPIKVKNLNLRFIFIIFELKF